MKCMAQSFRAVLDLCSARSTSKLARVGDQENILFQHARTQIVATVDEARDMVWNLRNAEKIHLVRSLEAIAGQASEAFGISVAYIGNTSPGMVSTWPGMKC